MSIENDLICRHCHCLVEDCECDPDDIETDLELGDMGETGYEGDG